MIGLIGKRVAALAPVLLGISLAAFLSLALCPGDAAKISLMAMTGSETPPAAAVEQVRAQMGLDRPLAVQYWRWLGRIARGDFGLSYQTGRPVVEEVGRALVASAMLATAAMALTIALAAPAGILAALNNRGWWDRLCLAGCVAVGAVPNFFLAIVLILIFAIRFKLVPVAGYGTPGSLALPALSLALINAAVSARLMRTSMLEALGQRFLTAARGRGLTETMVIGRHALRSAAIPMVSYLGTQFGYLFGGAAVVETLFLWPGLGRLLVDAVRSRDVFVVQGCVLAIAGAFVTINLAADLIHALIDPRVGQAQTGRGPAG